MRHPQPGGRPPVESWRADIDGLRAVAILAVLGYHFFPGGVQAGFIGVDVFFVISGFLITRLLLAAQEAGRFTLLSFYAARARRLFPALLVVLAATALAGWALLYEQERASLGGHLAAGAGFFANLRLWSESGYFDVGIDTKPLAHLWSLGVEEQFYLVWPLLLWLLAGRRWMPHAVGLLALASLLAAVALVRHDRDAAFYLPVFRFWELMAGSAVALFERSAAFERSRPHADRLSIAGFLLLSVGLLLIHSGMPFPGWWALLPVAGTALVIVAGPAAGLNRFLLSNRVMVGIGLVSYPLYLWHWPVLTFSRITLNAEPRAEAMLVLVGVSFLLAWVTWRWIETPLRHGGSGGAKALVLTSLVACVGVGGWHLGRVPGPLDHVAPAARIPPPPEQLLARNPDVLEGCGLPDAGARDLFAHCVHDVRGSPRFALVGDSKAAVLFNGIVRTSSPAGRWLFIGGARKEGALTPVLSSRPEEQYRQPGVRAALDAVRRNPAIETVVIATATRNLYGLPRDDSIEGLAGSPRQEEVVEGLRAFTSELLRAGKKVVLLVDNPTLADPRRCLLPSRLPALAEAGWLRAESPGGCRVTIARHLALAAPYHRLLEEVRQLAPDRIQVFDTLPLLCDRQTGTCALLDAEGVLYSYSDHISDLAAGRIGAALNQALVAPAPRP